MSAWYNEIDGYAARWLGRLVNAGHIAAGPVVTRSIRELAPVDCGATQCHFFAGIGGWSYALRLAGWADDVAVWTGSCPCQPFSQAGRGDGFADDRHLWPVWFPLIRECRPPVVFGEQVASRAGRAWLDLVSADLEGLGYSFGAAVLPAAGIGAPHIRHRLFWVADATGARSARAEDPGEDSRDEGGWARVLEPQRGGGVGRLGHADSERAGRDRGTAPRTEEAGEGSRGDDGRVGDVARASGRARGVGNADSERRQDAGGGLRAERLDGGCINPWADLVWLPCRDGKTRPTQPGLQPLADGLPGRVGRLRGYGNAIVPQVAAVFVRVFMESRGLL